MICTECGNDDATVGSLCIDCAEHPHILDLFAGPGGWDEGLKTLGRTDTIGVEWDKDACATAEAAGHRRVQADIREVDPMDFSPIEGIIASPPCQTFSLAGKQQGGTSLEQLASAIRMVSEGFTVKYAVGAQGLDAGDPRTTLVIEPMRFIVELRPRWIVFEEVPRVLHVWKEYASILTSSGYSVWTGILNAADYGVPQSRKRAFLIATLDGTARPPEPTHSNAEGLFLEPWVTMAEALDLDEPESPAHAWAWKRPATTVVRSFCPDVIAAPGWRKKGDGPRQTTPGSFKVTPHQMCILQGIRTDYPFQGSPTKKKSLIGAILPPPWASAILATVIR